MRVPFPNRPIRVRLTCDLTSYHDSLTAGVEGYAYQEPSRLGDRFADVRFPQTFLPVLWKGLEIIDKEYLEWKEQEEKEFNEKLKTATNVVKYVGPRGGFRCLSFSYVDGGYSCGFYERAMKFMKVMEEAGIPIRTEVEK